MPHWKRIVILANSIKRKKRCVAGKEISWDSKQYHISGWIRPIDQNEAEGAVAPQVMQYEDGTYPQILDVAYVPVLANAGDENHPEDWIIDTSRRWQRLCQFPANDVPQLCDEGIEMWHYPDQPNRVPGGYVSKMTKPVSLMLVKPPAGWSVSFYKELNRNLIMETKAHLKLKLNPHDHVFSVNDPLLYTHFAHPVNTQAEGELIAQFHQPEDLYFTLSLTPPHYCWHYKILAAVIRGATT